ncbi:MAG: hypothetical protein BWX44_00226 [Spirochaetes bacterium ADurb.Bin001]|nr:MAG: hypothetical protein BWX44_00226 [Spirochaetes bacterium ADurb.Bin001]
MFYTEANALRYALIEKPALTERSLKTLFIWRKSHIDLKVLPGASKIQIAKLYESRDRESRWLTEPREGKTELDLSRTHLLNVYD